MSQKVTDWHGIDLDESHRHPSNFDVDGNRLPDDEAAHAFARYGTLVFRAISSEDDEIRVLHLIDDFYFMNTGAGYYVVTNQPARKWMKITYEESAEWEIIEHKNQFELYKETDWHGINLKETAALDSNQSSTTESMKDEDADTIHGLCCSKGNLVYELFSGILGGASKEEQVDGAATIRVFHLHYDYYFTVLLNHMESNNQTQWNIGTREESWEWINKITEKYGNDEYPWRTTHHMF